jgi:2-methylcitrate dehydratase PrpD
MNSLDALVELSRSAAQTPDEDALKTLVMHNAAGAAGEHVETKAIEQALTDLGGPGYNAFRLAASMHARTQDDFHPIGRVHVGAVVIPAVSAVSTDDPLPALAAGYEVLLSVASAYSAIAQERGYRPTGVFGPVGAAAAAGTALALDDSQLASALALASTMSAGTNQSWIDGSDEWLVEVASASRAGVEAALLAKAGVRGASRAFEGVSGWSAAYFGDDGAQLLRRVLASRESRTADVAIKLYPISGIAQLPTHLAGKLGKVFERAEPERIEIRMPPTDLAYPGSRNRGPFHSRSDSLMSVSRCVALAYLNGVVPYRRLLEPPTAEETRMLRSIELIPDVTIGEEAASVTVAVAGEERSERGSSRDLLYPGWEVTSGELGAIARRSEAPEDLIVNIHEAIEDGVDLNAVTRLIGESHVS